MLEGDDLREDGRGSGARDGRIADLQYIDVFILSYYWPGVNLTHLICGLNCGGGGYSQWSL